MKKKAKAKAAPKRKSAPSTRGTTRIPRDAIPQVTIGLGSPVVFASPEGPRAAIVHGFAEPGPGLALTVFSDAGPGVKLNVLQGDGEVGTWNPSDV